MRVMREKPPIVSFQPSASDMHHETNHVVIHLDFDKLEPHAVEEFPNSRFNFLKKEPPVVLIVPPEVIRRNAELKGSCVSRDAWGRPC